MTQLSSVFILLFITAIYADDPPLIEISNGWLQGTLEKSYNGRTFSSFEGIPYARPPIGELRFETPREPYNWTGTWIANTKHTCLQLSGSAVAGDEDCLYINVYVPREKPSPSDNLNVIAHIHGGGFTMWSSHFYSGPKYLMDEDVIFVTMNYRLHAFGFLSTEDETLPGNNGLKDQVLSLKWIQKNIKYFGGNPESVTITGMSAGGISVHLHYFSPLSKDLFHRGVSQSGTALNPFTFKTGQLEKAKSLAEKVGCSMDTSRELVDCLKSRSGNKIIEALKVLSEGTLFDVITFGPVIERENDEAFLTQHPYRMLIDKSVADIPWIVSVTKEEGSFLLSLFKSSSEVLEQFNEIAPRLLMYEVEDDQKSSVINKIKEYYFEESASGEEIMKLLNDRIFIANADTSAKLQAQANKSPVYFYFFGYRGQHCLLDYMLPNTDHIGASHGDDVQYYLHTAVAEEILSESDEKMKSVFLKWLLTYADGQEPEVDGCTWKPVRGDHILEFLHIEKPDALYLEAAEDFGSTSFWTKLPLKENEYNKVLKDEL